MTDCTSCGGCAGGCGGCRSHVLLLTEPELRLLRQFAELAFLPAACTRTDETPVYLDGSETARRPARRSSPYRSSGSFPWILPCP